MSGVNMKSNPHYRDPPLLKADPFAFNAQLRPDTASKVFNIEGTRGEIVTGQIIERKIKP